MSGSCWEYTAWSERTTILDSDNKTNEVKENKKSLARLFDNALLTYSSTKLGLTDYDKNKDYNQEEKKAGLKEFGLIIAITLGFIAVAAVLVVFVLT